MEAGSERERMVNPRKACTVDTGLIPVLDRKGHANLGLALETAVLLELERRRFEVTYVRTPEGYEVDFLAPGPNGESDLIQVCSDMSASGTASRELKALASAAAVVSQATPLVLTLTRDGFPAEAPPGVRVQAAYEWALELPQRLAGVPPPAQTRAAIRPHRIRRPDLPVELDAFRTGRIEYGCFPVAVQPPGLVRELRSVIRRLRYNFTSFAGERDLIRPVLEQRAEDRAPRWFRRLRQRSDLMVLPRHFATGCQIAWFLTTTLCILPTLEAARKDVLNDILQPVFRQSCVKCHGENGNPTGNVDLFSLRSAADLTKNPELLRNLVKALDSGVMPPAPEPPLATDTRQQIIAELRGLLHVSARNQRSLPHTPMRRMNRFQYNNAVQDLFELRVDVFALPERMLREYGYFRPESGRMPDELEAGSRPLGKSQLIGKRLAGVAPFPQDLRAEHGYDNRGDHLTMSPLLLEEFLRLSQSIVQSGDFNAETVAAWMRLFAVSPKPGETRVVVTDTLRGFLARAFRRPVEDALLERYADHAMARIESGDSFADGMKAAVSAALASPRFLYLYERAGTGNADQRLDGFELASRLSFFLWGSIPDEILLEIAAEGRLHEPAVLREQVDRMLRDARLKRFCDSFPTQWLQLERIVSSVPDRQRFPEFYFAKFRSSMHMMLEPLLLFETVLIEDRSILELVDSDFSYRSELLDSWYRDGTRPEKVPPVQIPFRRVPVTDRRQGGVITNVAVMTMTSGPTETRPITRGSWISGVIFNDPPDPPPADVPLLPNKEAVGESADLTLRDRFEAHRTQADCASCHVKIDPLGFALENYGPTGVWRDTYENDREVDASGVLFGRHRFDDIVEFKDAILAEKDRFARAFAGHLLEFALGRELGVSDELALDRIVRETASNDYRIQEMIRQIVLSDPFLRKYNPVKRRKRSL